MNKQAASLIAGALSCWLVVMAVAYAAESGGTPPPQPPPSSSTDCSAGTNFAPYGWVDPSNPDPKYNLGYPDPNQQDMVAFVAKGNLVFGDYTDPDFKTAVPPLITGPKTRPYAVDLSDAALGYVNTGSSACGAQNCFDGNYDQQDRNPDGTPATKQDGSPRKFYEMSIPDSEWGWNVGGKGIIESPRISKTDNGLDANGNPRHGGAKSFDGVFYSDHGVIGKLGAQQVFFNGSIVARDDALIYNNDLTLSHDVRLLDAASAKIGLPNEIGRPALVQWQECPPAGCAAP